MNAVCTARAALCAGFLIAATLVAPARAAGQSTSTSASEPNRNHFDTDSIMRPPGFFDLIDIGPGKARWLVLTDPNPPSTPNRLVQTETGLPAGAIAAAIRRNVVFEDGAVSAFLRQGPGHAGLIVRMADTKRFLLVVADTATGETVVSSYREGKPTELARGKAAFENPWQKLTVRLAGPDVAVTFGRTAIAAKDPAPAPGRAGLASEGPGEASFDELVLEPAGKDKAAAKAN